MAAWSELESSDLQTFGRLVEDLKMSRMIKHD